MQEPVVCFVIGTRPEAIKVAPVIIAMRRDGRFAPVLITSGQQTRPVLEALETFDLSPDITLDVSLSTGSPNEFPAQLIPAFDAILSEIDPAACMVHGDTITAVTSALAAFWRGIPVVHLEAGLRNGRHEGLQRSDQGNRRIIDHLASLHLAPTAGSAMNLIREGLTNESIVITGNTVVDAIQEVASRDLPYSDTRLTSIEDSNRRIVVLSVHRGETSGEPLQRILEAVRRIVAGDSTLHVVVPTPAHPEIDADLRTGFSGIERVLVCDQLPYSDMARLLANASLVLTDSSGLQEEAPTFDVPVLVLRETTERPEGIASGVAKLVGANAEAIVHESLDVLAGVAEWNTCGYGTNPFGDGFASERSVAAIGWMLGLEDRPGSFNPETADAILNRPLIYAVA
jgi:UDP-N-acetylglucosamine 2-epimerase (non-hydrolysing)